MSARGTGTRAPAPSLPSVIGHRGAAARAPENTLAGFRIAKLLGCGWIEFDVRLTADDVLVVCHDDRLERTTSGYGMISKLPLAAIREVDAGTWFDPRFADERVPTLYETLVLCRDLGLGANVEIKAEHGQASNWTEIAGELGCATINADQRYLSEGLVADVSAAGYPVLAYTVNDAARARQLFGWGITSVFSDAPDIILAEAAPQIRDAARRGAIV